MVLLQYLSTTVFRYYIKQLLIISAAPFSRRSAIFIEMNFRNPKTLTNMDLRNPKTLTSMDFETKESF